MNHPTLRIRTFEAGDERPLREVFHFSIHTHVAADHSPAQLSAWSPTVVDAALESRWAERMRRIRPFVAEVDGGQGREIVGYADVQPDGYIDHFFVAGEYGRRGVGTRLMDHLLAIAHERGTAVLTSDVSRTAQPFFASFGFVVSERRTLDLRGVEFSRARMRLELGSSR